MDPNDEISIQQRERGVGKKKRGVQEKHVSGFFSSFFSWWVEWERRAMVGTGRWEEIRPNPLWFEHLEMLRWCSIPAFGDDSVIPISAALLAYGYGNGFHFMRVENAVLIKNVWMPVHACGGGVLVLNLDGIERGYPDFLLFSLQNEMSIQWGLKVYLCFL